MEHNDLFDFEVLFNGVRPEEIVVKECSFHQRCKQSENGGEAIDLAEKSVSINGVVKCIDELLDVIEELEENSDAVRSLHCFCWFLEKVGQKKNF